ncbi:glycosyltransferase [uncultured Clostridium sp.]|uniref:glycosyltransferase n=1 Tax=uncultured Clostridium sp. TaxID=59620 RepID=UPI0025E8EB32|nr:glycosyltransferase [uncultured Clostridium sp.]
MYESGITVIIPIYNSGKYLDEMLDSVYNQTFEDYNVVLINDGSSDNSEDIALKYVKKNSNTKYIYQKNKGVSEARNTGIAEISKKYTLFLDSDDYINKKMFEKMYEKAERVQADIVMCSYKTIYDNCSKTEEVHLNMDENNIYSNTQVMEMMLKMKIEGQLWNKMFLSKSLVDFHIKFERGRIIEDLFPVVSQVSRAEKIVYIDEPLYNYRQNSMSLLHSNKELDVMRDQVFAYKKIAELVKEHNIVSKEIYSFFIAFTEASNIKKCVEMNLKCNNDIYKKYEIDNMSIKDIFISKVSIKVKIKLCLFKMRILHVFYYLSVNIGKMRRCSALFIKTE